MANDKRDCFIDNLEGEVFVYVFTISNNIKASVLCGKRSGLVLWFKIKK